MSIMAMSLGLPLDIDADVFAIEDGADALDQICLTMFGRAEGLDGQFNGAANQFTDLIAWDISDASTKELESWRNAGGSLTHGAAVLRLWSEDIKEYRRARARLHERWETAKTIAQSRVDSPVVSLVIFDGDGQFVWRTGTGDIDLGRVEGKLRVTFNMISVPLQEGRYFVTVGIHDRSERTVHDWHDQRYGFDVSGTLEDEGGIFIPVGTRVERL
jgi:hypothetical protein